MASTLIANELLAGEERCPACGSQSPLRAFHVAHDGRQGERVSVMECLRCRLAWQFPLSRTSEQSTIYFAKQYAAAESQTYFDKETRLAVAKLQLKFVQSLRPQPGTLLDIGAGDGTFIDVAAQAGWNCIGLEPAARQEFHRMTADGGVATLTAAAAESLRGQQFDLVTLWDVIEHIDKPIELLRTAASLLSDNGLLVIETGNYCSADRIEGDSKWWCYQLDHRWYFSPTTLQPILHGLQLTQTHLADRVFRPWWNGQAQYRAPSWWSTCKALLRAPGHPLEILRRHAKLRYAAQNWNPGAGLGVFTLAASRGAICTEASAPVVPGYSKAASR